MLRCRCPHVSRLYVKVRGNKGIPCEVGDTFEGLVAQTDCNSPIILYKTSLS